MLNIINYDAAIKLKLMQKDGMSEESKFNKIELQAFLNNQAPFRQSQPLNIKLLCSLAYDAKYAR